MHDCRCSCRPGHSPRLGTLRCRLVLMLVALVGAIGLLAANGGLPDPPPGSERLLLQGSSVRLASTVRQTGRSDPSPDPWR